MNFCPECGTPRSAGQFCAGCGFKFPSTISITAFSTSQSLQAGWYPDESNTNLEKFWDGSAWTEQTRYSSEHQIARDSLLSLLEYGKGFDASTHCYNCGEPVGRRSKVCGLCETEIR